MTGLPGTTADRSLLALDPRWLAVALPTTLAFVGPASEVTIPLESAVLDRTALLDALTPELDREALRTALDATADDVAELVATLAEAGVLARPAPGASSTALGLGEALLAAHAGDRLTGDGPVTIVTADELLVLPAELDVADERAALRAFVGGLTPDLRLRAYCQLVAERATILRGDRPDPAALAGALATARGAGADALAVVDLASGDLTAVKLDALGRLGCERPHRLGALLASGPLERSGRSRASGLMHVHVARYAVANLRFPEPSDSRLGGGRSEDPELAALIAHAEAAERYGSGDSAGHELRRTRAADLDAPFVAPDDLFRANERQRRPDLIDCDPALESLWTPGANPAGERRWVPADAVFYPFLDPLLGGRMLPTSSSGAAAHTSLAEARLRALCELVERDAFMWTWVQRVERELVDESSLPAGLAERAAAVTARGLEIVFVNLTLDLMPVLGCVIRAEPSTFSLALACSPDPAVAAERALKEAIGLVDTIDRGRLTRVAPEDVRTPEQHAALHLDPERIERSRFLYGSDDRVGLSEIGRSDTSPFELVASVGEPVAVDLSSPALAPFHVVRVVVPHLVPVSFGYDREPLGMARLAQPKRTHDGRTLGEEIDLAQAGPLDPHPFA